MEQPPTFEEAIQQFREEVGPEFDPFIFQYMGRDPDANMIRADWPELAETAIVGIIDQIASIEDDPQLSQIYFDSINEYQRPSREQVLADLEEASPGSVKATPEPPTEGFPTATEFPEEQPAQIEEIPVEDPGEGLVEDDPLVGDEEKQRQQDDAMAAQIADLEAKLDQDVLARLDQIMREMEQEKVRETEQAKQQPRTIQQVNIGPQAVGAVDAPLSLKQRLDQAQQKFAKGKISGEFRLNPEENASILVLGKTRSGKSTLIKILMNQDIDKFDRVILVSQTAGFKGEYDFLKPKLEVVSSFDPEDIRQILETKQRGGPEALERKWLIVFDDIIGMPNLKIRGQLMKSLITTGRHSGCTLIFMSQKFTFLPTEFRTNLSQVFILNVEQREVKSFYDEFGSVSEMRKTPFMRLVKSIIRTKSFGILFDAIRAEYYVINIVLEGEEDGVPFGRVEIIEELFNGGHNDFERDFKHGKGKKTFNFEQYKQFIQENHQLLNPQEAEDKALMNFIRLGRINI